MNEVIVYVGVCMSVLSFSAVWFMTDLAAHLINLLRLLAFPWRNNKEFWAVTMEVGEHTMLIDSKMFTKHDSDKWIAKVLHPLAGELSRCPYCLSFHTAFWFSVLFQYLGGAFNPLMFVASWFSGPAIILIFFGGKK
jgi:hypothetical protein